MSYSSKATSNAPTKPMMKEQTTTKEGRKQLPSIPDAQTQAIMAARPKQHTPVAKANTNGYGQFLLEYSMMAEYALVPKQKIPGCYVIPSAMSCLVWYGVLFIRQGLYQEGAFKFTIIIPDNFPDGDCPSLVFDLPVFHPLVDPLTGELDVRRAFQKWRRNVNHIWQILMYARRVFYKIDSKSPLNKEAADLYETDLESFKKRVIESIEKSKAKLPEPVKSDDPHCVRFSSWDPTVHEETRQNMLKPKESESGNKDPQTAVASKGLTWIKPGSVEIFSRDDSAVA